MFVELALPIVILPTIDEDFAKNRHLVQLNMINDVLSEFVFLGCGYDTKDKALNYENLTVLKPRGILGCWVGIRRVSYDGFPTLGELYRKDRLVDNIRCTTHLGSGGASFGPAAVLISRDLNRKMNERFLEKVLKYDDSCRFH